MPRVLGVMKPIRGKEIAVGLTERFKDSNARALQTLSLMTARDKQSLLRGSRYDSFGYYIGNTPAIPHLGIPALNMQDASNGFRPTMPGTKGTVTCFPSMLAVAATWDEDIVARVGHAMGMEFRGKGANVMLGPSINVHRVASNGRNFEYLSGEDPYLGSRLVRPFIAAVQSTGVMATAKHFAFNEQETQRFTENSIVDERSAWELYYPPFEAAVQAGVGAVMCSYNRVNGSYACQNSDLIRRDLKGRMNFRGFVMSDWGALHDASGLIAGTDQEMPGAPPGEDKESIYNQDALATIPHSEQHMDEAVRNILASIYSVRLDQQETCTPPCIDPLQSDQGSMEHGKVARQAATSSVVLLKNDGTLPLRPGHIKKLGIVGKAAFLSGLPLTVEKWHPGDFFSGGGSGHVPTDNVTTLLQAISQRAHTAGITVTTPKTKKEVLEADVIVIAGGASAHEGEDRSNLNLYFNANELIQTISKLKPTVVLMMTPGAVLTPWRDEVNAVMNIFLGGEQSSFALTSTLFGDEAPSGKLPIMLPATENDVIQPGTLDVKYGEGVFTSYRSKTLKAAFPFGHGLSYTNFAYGEPAKNASCSSLACISFLLNNTGSREGREIAQAYVGFPSVPDSPEFVLRGFHKTRLLQPGESAIVTFEFTQRDLSSYEVGKGWVLQNDAVIHIGASSADIRHVLVLGELHS